MRALRPQHQQFLLEWTRDGNATAAYRRAGYRATGHAAEVNASRLLHRPDVARVYRAITACAGAHIRLRLSTPSSPQPPGARADER